MSVLIRSAEPSVRRCAHLWRSARVVSGVAGVALGVMTLVSAASGEASVASVDDQAEAVALNSASDNSASDNSASDHSAQARQFVQSKHAELHQAVKASKDPKTDPAVLAVFDGMLDYEALTQDSLGSQWGALKPEQQKQFSTLLKELVQKSYRTNLRDPDAYSVEYTGEVGAAKGTLVKTLAQKKANKREKPLGIDYVVGSDGTALKVRDVVTDGVSLVGNYRSQFKRIIKKKGFDGLLEQMRKQLDK